MAKRFLFLSLALLLAACQQGGAMKEPAADAGPRDKAAPLTETATPNKPATKEAADVEGEDLEALKAELNALNSDLSRLRNDLVTTDATRSVPDPNLATPRALTTKGVIDIPDSKAELSDRPEAVQVTGIRVGAHPDKTRLVFDLEGEVGQAPEVSLENDKSLIIKFFSADWPGSSAQTSSLNEQLGVFKVVKQKDDTLVTLTLDRPTSLKSHTMLPPATPGGPQRLVVDLAPAS